MQTVYHNVEAKLHAVVIYNTLWHRSEISISKCRQKYHSCATVQTGEIFNTLFIHSLQSICHVNM